MDKQGMFHCRLCGQDVVRKEWGGGECTACGSVSAASIPTEDELNTFYGAYNDTYKGGGGSGGKNLVRYAARYLQYVSRYVRSGDLLDVGSSNNPFPNVAAGSGFSVTVMDFARPKDLSPEVGFVKGNINDESGLSSLGRTYDVVTAWAVLEHTPDPVRSCRILAHLCRPGGMVCVSTPEIGTSLTKSSIGRSAWFYPPEHLNLISPVAMQAVFHEQGCELLEWGRVELNLFRYLARYGIGLIESLAGFVFKKICSDQWERMREKRLQRFQGITYFIFKKRESAVTEHSP